MYSLIDLKRLIYQFNGANPHILKILPIWNKYWKKSEKLLYKIGLSPASIKYGKKMLGMNILLQNIWQN